MSRQQFNHDLISFLDASPTPFHAVKSMRKMLENAGFQALDEKKSWNLGPGKYFVTRNDSSIIAFIRGEEDPADTGIRMVGAHTDSPCLKVKPNPGIKSHGYLNLGVEVYGGVLLNPWFDRDLSIAGRVTVQNAHKKIQSVLINFDRAVATIPSLAIHLDREANKQRTVNPQKDIPPLLMLAGEKRAFEDLLKEQIKKEHPELEVATLLGFELSFYNMQGAAITGMANEFLASARLDNLLSCYTGIESLLHADETVTSLMICSDHEEVGSASAEGAEGPFLKTTLERMLPNKDDYHRAIANSLLISTDNAHGIHPNYPDKHDANHGPLLNNGPVIKINANQRYATNSETSGYFVSLCTANDVPHQTFVTRTDMACGSTIGPITAKALGVKTLDVGVPTFAMHSIRELAGSEDAYSLARVLKAFYSDTGSLSAAGQ
ncbi:M18 family aminopeptidase [Pseudomonadales bacterium]|jgi:aspartyl aminopeptidase|nr:M18 family aminopeptidase [Gammaproteobacteria bacterium]MDC1478539.1 M18 family aminopeptidase [Pseudomonadales bacterium]|tara:strand:+ start:5600 stop:6904 length:1305 start_codon:yes stop_codon:yes gene_type:complete